MFMGSHSFFLDFFCETKKNNSQRKSMLFGGRVENLSSPTISQIEQNLEFYFIYKDWSRVQKYIFFTNLVK